MSLPLVSVIVPCFNEERTIALLLDALRGQDYPRDRMEVVIADGLSTDGTRAAIARYRQAHPEMDIRLVDNPDRHIPAALNRAIEAARGEVIVRLDAHAVPMQDYVRRCVEALNAGKGDNVGGVWGIRPGGDSAWAEAIAAAAAHPLGVGDARYRLGGQPGAVDTVPFGAFHRSLVERIGGFDETLLTNEDYEFNVRVRRAGGTVWFDPAIRSQYFARSSLRALARQYWRYGYWKARMLQRYPETLRWRQMAGLFVLNWLVLVLLSLWFAWARWLLLIEAVLYGCVLFVAGLERAIRRKIWHLVFTLPVAIAVMHFSWGSGFLWSVVMMLLKACRGGQDTMEVMGEK